MKPEDQRVTVAIGEPMQGAAGPKTLIVGMPFGAWRYMKDGKTHHFDLSALGIPLQVMIFGGKDGDDVRRTLADANVFLASGTLDADGNLRDLGIKEPTNQ